MKEENFATVYHYSRPLNVTEIKKSFLKVLRGKVQIKNEMNSKLKLLKQGCYSNNRIKFPDFSLTILRKIFV